MIVFNLQCDRTHRFEGWFANHASFEDQRHRGLVECPVCGTRHIEKLLSAPRVNRGVGRIERQSTVQRGSIGELCEQATEFEERDPSAALLEQTPEQALAQSIWLKLVRHVVETTEDVGTQFAEEARRIHYREAPERGIRGQTSVEEARMLADEGIDVVSFPLPVAFKGPMQ